MGVIRRFDPETSALVPVDGSPPHGWLHVSDPTAADVKWLLEQVGVPAEFLPHALDVDEVARIERADGGEVLVMMRAPICDTRAGCDLPYRSSSLAVVVLRDLLVTVSRHDPQVALSLCRMKGLDPTRPHRFLLQLMLALGESFLEHLRRLNGDVDRIEDELQASTRNREVLSLLRLQKGLVHFTTALRSNEILLDRLEEDPPLEVSPGDRALLEDAQIELRQAIEMTTVARDILGSMMDAFASIISNNLNIVMKVMAALTIVLAVPNTVAALYGMNVALPGQGHPGAFVAVLVVSLVGSLALALLFRRRRWL
jgi:magnesium transporter